MTLTPMQTELLDAVEGFRFFRGGRAPARADLSEMLFGHRLGNVSRLVRSLASLGLLRSDQDNEIHVTAAARDAFTEAGRRDALRGRPAARLSRAYLEAWSGGATA